jgi:hypothetical protein
MSYYIIVRMSYVIFIFVKEINCCRPASVLNGPLLWVKILMLPRLLYPTCITQLASDGDPDPGSGDFLPLDPDPG